MTPRKLTSEELESVLDVLSIANYWKTRNSLEGHIAALESEIAYKTMTLKQAKKILGNAVQTSGIFKSVSPYNTDINIIYTKGDESASVDGELTADELEAIAVVMRDMQKKGRVGK